MNVILLEKVAGLGELGDRVDVKSGYARNFLIPQGKATEATKANIERFEARRAELEKQQAERLADAERRAAALSGKVLTVLAKAGDEGKLFGSVGTQDIAEAAIQQGLQLVRSEVMMPNGTIREIGEYNISLHLFAGITTEVLVRVVASE
ncbi:MAG: 50S ribosomal protein L9 [Cardiobacteriaceae bacterium]|nr:50S ribosomal protein L9 [Cardiobacteriaceae bacterium]